MDSTQNMLRCTPDIGAAHLTQRAIMFLHLYRHRPNCRIVV